MCAPRNVTTLSPSPPPPPPPLPSPPNPPPTPPYECDPAFLTRVARPVISLSSASPGLGASPTESYGVASGAEDSWRRQFAFFNTRPSSSTAAAQLWVGGRVFARSGAYFTTQPDRVAELAMVHTEVEAYAAATRASVRYQVPPRLAPALPLGAKCN